MYCDDDCTLNSGISHKTEYDEETARLQEKGET